MAAFPYQLYGGATRPDALNFNDPFSQALVALYNGAPPAVQAELGLTSGFRSRAVQEALFAKSDRTGHSVARPGHSKHESGNAADLYGFGLKGGGPQVSEATRAWVHGNAGNYGLYFPMGHEPWHIQLQGAGGGGGGAPAPTSAPAAAPSIGPLLAEAVDPRTATLGALTGNMNRAITDTAVRRGGLAGEGSAGGGLSVHADSDPGVPPLETASARAPLDTLGANAPPMAPGPRLGQLADLFKQAVIGQAAAKQETVAGQARPLRSA